jgi:hypothetical protein
MAIENGAPEEFDVRVDHLLQTTCEVARALANAHEAAMAMIAGGDWSRARKYFSLSDKYDQWKDFTHARERGRPARARRVREPGALPSGGRGRATSHLAALRRVGWKASAAARPPRVPIVGEDGLNYGLLQVSDRADGGDFDVEDERRLQCLADAAAVGLDALRKVRALRAGEKAPAAPVEAQARFVVIEPA